MINGLEGIPGSGKSYEAVVFHVLAALKRGRLVITNLPLIVETFAAMNPEYRDLIELRTRTQPIRGTWDAERVDDKGNGNAFELFEDRHTEKPAAKVSLFGHVWDYWTEWRHDDGTGPLFVIDECHVAMPTIGTDEAVIEWYKLHRHFNVDVLLCTQSFRDMNQPIARLIGILVKVRKADILGKADHYIRKVHGGYRGALISSEERKYLPQMFALYRSHTQGKGVAEQSASDMKPFIVKFKRFTWAFWAVTIVVCAWAFWPTEKAKPAAVARPKSPPVDWEAIRAEARPSKTTDAPASPQPAEGKATPADPSEVPEPYGSKGLHLTGRLVMKGRTLYTFAISNSGQRIADTNSDELRAAGYRWEPLAECMGTLRWKNSAKPVTCDAPAIPQGSKQDPVVIAVPKGSSAPIASSDGPRTM